MSRPAEDRGSLAPPALSRAVFERLAPPEDRAYLLGDLAEEFRARVATEGPAAARRWYRRQMLGSIPPLVGQRLRGWTRTRREPMLTDLGSDLRFALRLFRRTPLASGAIVTTMAVGVAAVTAICSAVNALLLRPLPFPDSRRIVRVATADSRSPDADAVSFADVQDWRAARSLLEVAPYTASDRTLTGAGEPVALRTVRVGDGFDRVLGLVPALGRPFIPEEFHQGSEAVAILSDRTWRTLFAADRAVVGSLIQLDNLPCRVVGVLPPLRFEFPRADIWIPLIPNPDDWQSSRRATWLSAIGRVRPGASLRTAQIELSGIGKRLALAYPETNATRGVRIEPLDEYVVGPIRPMILLLSGAVALVLIIACLNIVNLRAAQAQSRRREFAVRAAIGAGVGRLGRQSLTEGLLLAVTGGVAGVLLAPVLVRGLISLYPGLLPRADEIRLDPAVLGVAVVSTLLAGTGFGLAQARVAASTRLVGALKGSQQSGPRGWNRLRNGLVASQVAFSVALLIAGSLLLETLWRLGQVNPGFKPLGAVSFSLSLSGVRHPGEASVVAFYDALLARLRELPGVQAAGASNAVPLSGNPWSERLVVEGDERPDEQRPIMNLRIATPGYLQALGIPLIGGRDFDTRDRAGSSRVALVSRHLAREALGSADPVGRRVRFVGESWEIVGVVDDIHHTRLTGEPDNEFYIPLPDLVNPTMAIVVRTTGDPMGLVESIRREVAELDPTVPMRDVVTMDRRVADAMAPERFRAVLIGGLAILALLLSVLGLYGVVSYVVSRRTREIGIRIALGEQPARVRRSVLVGALRVATAGSAVGLGLAVVFSRMLQGFLAGMSRLDAPVMVGVPMLMLLVAAIAAYPPARRASRVDPLESIRSE